MDTPAMAGWLEDQGIELEPRGDGLWRVVYTGLDQNTHSMNLDAETHDDAVHEAFTLLCEQEP